jgi:hypothetical protein
MPKSHLKLVTPTAKKRKVPRTVLILRLRFRQFFHSGFLCMRDARPASA